MLATLDIQRIKVPREGGADDGVLVLCGDALVAIFACLAEAFYSQDQGRWYLEVGFGRCDAGGCTFDTLEDALRWVAMQIGVDPEQVVVPAVEAFRAGAE